MPGPAKNNLRNTATAVLTKDEAKRIKSPLVRTSSIMPPVADDEQFRLFVSNLQSEITDLKQSLAILRARLDKFIVTPITGAVTYPV